MTMPATGTPGTDPNAQASTDPKDDAAAKDDAAQQETPEQKAERLEAENAALKANSRKWEDRAKANKAKADEFDKLQASNASDGEKLAAALKGKEEAETKLARYEVAARTGLDLELAEMLSGDEDAMEEQAKKLLARIAPAKPERQAPKPDPSQGGGGGRETKLSAADEGRAEAQRRLAARKKS